MMRAYTFGLMGGKHVCSVQGQSEDIWDDTAGKKNMFDRRIPYVLHVVEV